MKTWNIKPSSILYKGLNLLQKAYFNWPTLINRDNGWPIFWTTMILLIILPFWMTIIFPIIYIIMQSLEYYRTNLTTKQFAARISIGIIYIMISYTGALYLFGQGAWAGALLQQFMRILIGLGIVSGIIFTVISLYCLIEYSEKRDERIEQEKKDHLKANPDYVEPMTIGKYITVGISSWYNNNCPKITWYEDPNNPTVQDE